MKEQHFTTKSVQLRIFGYRDEFSPIARPDVVRMFSVLAFTERQTSKAALDSIGACISDTVMEMMEPKKRETQFTQFDRS